MKVSEVWRPAATRDSAERLVVEATTFHLEGLAHDGLPLPQPAIVEVGRVQLPA